MMRKLILSILLVLAMTLTGCATLKSQGLAACPPAIDGASNIGLEEVSAMAASDTDEPEATDSMPETEEEETDTQELSEPEEQTSMELSPEEEALPRKTVIEGELVDFPNLKAIDPDGDELTYSFSEPLNENGAWQTQEGDAGKYTLTITASDGVNAVTQNVLLIVEPANLPPTIRLLDPIEIKEGDTLLLQPLVEDPDGDDVQVAFSGWTNRARKETGFDDAGAHEVTVTASDGKSSSSKTVTIIVENVNRRPVIERLDTFELVEEERFKLSPIVSDPDGDEIDVSFSSPLDEDGEWTPQIGDAGNYRLKVSADDGTDVTEESFFIIVTAKNLPPTLKLSDVSVEEGETVVLEPEASDPEGEEVTLSYAGWMTSDTKETDYEDAGEHQVTVTASDGERETEREITVTVMDVNRPPQFIDGAFA